MSWDSWGWGWFGLVHLLWWVLVVTGIVVLVRWLWLSGSGPRWPDLQRDRAIDILRERYARGEIDKAEFEQRKHDLTG